MGQSMPFVAVNEPPRREIPCQTGLMSEIQRQEKYLSELPKDFKYPLFNTKRALESQRQNGYRNTAVADSGDYRQWIRKPAQPRSTWFLNR